MDDDYTPTTDDIRHYVCWYRDENAEHYSKEREALFDRWLAEHDQKIASMAWQQGHLATSLRDGPDRKRAKRGDPSTWNHGGSGSTYNNYGCRCDRCCEANTQRVRRRKDTRAEMIQEEHDRQVAETAWYAGLDAGHSRWYNKESFGLPPMNPYRKTRP